MLAAAASAAMNGVVVSVSPTRGIARRGPPRLTGIYYGNVTVSLPLGVPRAPQTPYKLGPDQTPPPEID